MLRFIWQNYNNKQDLQNVSPRSKAHRICMKALTICRRYVANQ